MSRSHRTDAPNPAVKFFEWSPQNGELRYYDKEKGENVPVKLPFTFMVLEDMAMVGGGTKRNGVFEGFWSNAVRANETKWRPFTVRSKQGVEAEGLYADLKDKKGLNYVKGLYIAFRESKNEPLFIGHLKFKGSAVGAWFDFLKTHRDIYKGAITIQSRSEVIHGDKGDYYTPIFVPKPDISEDSDEQAKVLDAEILQPFLEVYLNYQPTTHAPDEVPSHSGTERGDAWEPEDLPQEPEDMGW